MCSEFFRIPLEAWGVPLWGFGALLWLWLAFAGWGAWRAAQASGWSAALAGQLPSLAVVAAVIAFLPRYFPDGIPIRGYGVMVLLGSLLGIGMALARARQVGLPEQHIMGLALVMFVGGIVGARLFYVIEYWEPRIRQPLPDGGVDWPATLKAALSYTEGGLVVYGAFLGGMAAFLGYARRHKLPIWALADLIAPSMVAGLALGRIGCLLNGCCYGGESDLPWAITFPRENAPQAMSMPYRDQAARGRFYGLTIGAAEPDGPPRIVRVDPASVAAAAGLKEGEGILAINGYRTEVLAQAEQLVLEAAVAGEPLRVVTAEGGQREIPALAPPLRSLPVHPTQIYSAVNAALLAWVLWSYYPWRRRDGDVVTLMLLAYTVARFLLEAIRVDEPAVFGTGLSISQNISVVLFVAAAANWFRLRRQPPGKLAFGEGA